MGKPSVPSFLEYLSEQHLQEATGRGVQLEWAIVYAALKNAKSKDLSARIKQYPQLLPKDKTILADAFTAVSLVPEKLWPLAQHSDEVDMAVNGEPKTDILFGKNYRVSVKMEGAIQLSSAQGETTALMLSEVMEERIKKTPRYKNVVLEKVIKRIQNMPTVMISPQNLKRLQREQPNEIASMVKHGKILDEYNWRRWEDENREMIKDSLTRILEDDEDFTYMLIEEALTGKRVFAKSPLAIANYILTPSHFDKIDQKLIRDMVARTTIDIRAKSRQGWTAGTIRFDVRGQTKQTQLESAQYEQMLCEFSADDVITTLKDLGKKSIGTVKNWWTTLKRNLANFYKTNMDEILTDTVYELDVDVTIGEP